jgi:crossover junction endodeoxyribonuclease RuvC
MTEAPTISTRSLRVLGIDPGTLVVGYGVIEAGTGRRPETIARGALRLPSRPLAARLEMIFRETGRLIAAHRPRVLAIEEVFHGKNFQSVLKLGEARGVVILAAEIAGLEIREYSPALIKKAAAGNGNATKAQVAAMMQRILGLKEPFASPDEADALAAAYCHSTRLWRRAIETAPAGLPHDSARVPPHDSARRPRRIARPAPARSSPSGQSAPGSRKPVAAATVAALLRSGAARVYRGARFRKPARRKAGAR